MYGNIQYTATEERLIKERSELSRKLAAVLKACGGTVKVKLGDFHGLSEYKIDMTTDYHGDITFRLDNGCSAPPLAEPMLARPAIPADRNAADDVRNAVKALNEAMERAKDFGLRVDVDQVAFNPRKVVVKIWKNM